MELSPDDVRQVAALAKLEFSDVELESWTSQLGKIVTFVEQLTSVDTDGVEPMAHPLDLHSAIRPDVNVAGLDRDMALANAPKTDGEFFLVPPVMVKNR